MHIAVLSDWEDAGGANIAAFRLSEGMAQAGHRITRIYEKALTHDSRFETKLLRPLLAGQGLPKPLRAAWKLFPLSSRTRAHQSYAARQLHRILAAAKPDIVSIHNLHIAGWSPEMIRVCVAHAPTVCTLHDTWTVTGRCYNPGDCGKYTTGCDSGCPTASEYPALRPRQIRPAWELRRQIFRACENLSAIVPSSWLGRLARAGVWNPRHVFRIAYGLDLKSYSPVEQALARKILHLREEDPVLLCCATDLSNRKKGLHLLIDALRQCRINRRIQLLLMGLPASLPALPQIDIRQLGYVFEDRLKALVYSAADLYVHPSLADNAPCTVMEALSCGTPTLAFPIDGLPEMVIPERTGWLAAGVSSAFLGTALQRALADLDRGSNLRARCRAFAEQTYDLPAIIGQYEQVFRYMRSEQTGIPPLLVNAAPAEGSMLAARN
jgi:glycosyltransferase involved in cell wall biosynthesis